MELREWLIILGLALVTLIVVDGVRRLQRQRRIPRLDEVAEDAHGTDPDEEARKAELNWELPNGGARVVRPADYSRVQPKPKLQRQEHPGPSRVLSSWRASAPRQDAHESLAAEQAASRVADAGAANPVSSADRSEAVSRDSRRATAERESVLEPRAAAEAGYAEVRGARQHDDSQAEARREPTLAALDETPPPASAEPMADTGAEPLAADPRDHEEADDDERYRLVDFDGVGDSLKSGSKRMGASVHRFGASLQKSLAERREQKRLEKARREEEKARRLAEETERKRQAQARAEAESAQLARDAERRRLESEAAAAEDGDDPLFAPRRQADEANDAMAVAEEEAVEASRHSDKVRIHPVLEKALRHDVSAEHARLTLSQAEEIIVISVMARDDDGFSGTALLDLMLACGLRYDREMGVFHRFETEDPESRLQFSMVNGVKPGTFPIEAIDDFRTPGITLLMPLPGAEDCGAAFEAMVETAMVIVRHMGGELKDEHQSVMTAQTVEFARQRVQEFVRRNRLHRYQVN
ncbi:cell division protein ZipA [Halomonas sp. SSL-5]|uniref:cell division protein ZipA n=1 Tax=Halomonas sp. SSL-5 TaxID=3065855 RepID=UPI00273A5189|nr:cell division protein ZipA [Halomonas sp. SSL-5]MDY7117675.1 cell division protein ZipA [Halomonas sp. SSL-5]